MRRVIWILVVACLAAAGCGDDGSSVFSTEPTSPDGSVTTEGAANPGDGGVPVSDVLPPDAGTVIDTAAWGEVFDRRIVVRLADDAGSGAADDVAAAVGGTVAARVEDFRIAEIELAAGGEAALASALETLAGHPAVALAAPSSPLSGSWGVTDLPCGPLESPVLQADDRGDQFSLIGVEDAWRLVQASGVTAAKPTVGIVDGWGSHLNHHGGWVTETVAATDSPGTPPGVLDAILGDGSANFTSVDVFGPSPTTSVTAELNGVRQLVQPPNSATVINLSLGGAATPGQQAIVRQFLRDLAVSHPQVLVVAAAGNLAVDLASWAPGGLNEPNLVTVGGLNHQGERWHETWTDAAGAQQAIGSNYTGTGGEVTLAAIAQDTFVGMDSNGEPQSMTGTSFAAPQVTAAVAVLQALDPTLTGVEIKQILVDTAATDIANPDVNERITAVDPALGGRVLRVDNAVWRVLSQRLGVAGTREEVLSRATLNARARVADDDPLTYIIRAVAPAGGNGTTVTIAMSTNSAGGLVPSQTSLTTQDDVARWRWLFLDFGESAQVTLTRADTGACARLVMTADDRFPYAGTYEGSVPFAMLEGQDPYSMPFTLRVDQEGSVTGEGEGRQTQQVEDQTMVIDITVEFTGSVDGAGSLTLVAQVRQCASLGDERECGEGTFPLAWTIGPDGSLNGAIVWEQGEQWPIQGAAVSGGPADLP